MDGLAWLNSFAFSLVPFIQGIYKLLECKNRWKHRAGAYACGGFEAHLEMMELAYPLTFRLGN